MLGGKMKYPEFEDFLMDKFAEQYAGLDDEFPDSFSEWLDDLSVDDFLSYGTIYGNKQVEIALNNLKEKFNNVIN